MYSSKISGTITSLCLFSFYEVSCVAKLSLNLCPNQKMILRCNNPPRLESLMGSLDCCHRRCWFGFFQALLECWDPLGMGPALTIGKHIHLSGKKNTHHSKLIQQKHGSGNNIPDRLHLDRLYGKV